MNWAIRGDKKPDKNKKLHILSVKEYEELSETLTKYKKAFEILKEVLEIPEDDEVDWYDNNTDYYRLTTKRLLNGNERELLEEVMKDEKGN